MTYSPYIKKIANSIKQVTESQGDQIDGHITWGGLPGYHKDSVLLNVVKLETAGGS